MIFRRAERAPRRPARRRLPVGPEPDRPIADQTAVREPFRMMLDDGGTVR
jgi:hypothetical protein